MTERKTVVLTGGTGFLGFHLVPELVRAGYLVKLLNRPGSRHPQSSEWPEQVKTVELEFEDSAAIVRACAGASAVLHAAGLVSYDRKDQSLMQRTHVELTCRVLEAAKKAGIGRFLHVSSIVTIGHGMVPRNESSPYNASALRLAYWQTKLEAERLALAANSPGFEVVVVNPGSLLGQGERNGQLLPFLRKLLAAERAVLPDGGSDFLDCADAARGTVLALERGRPGERYILGSENLTYAEFHKKLRGAFNLDSRPRVMPRLPLSVATKLLEAFESLTGVDLPVNSARLRRVNGVYMFHELIKARTELGYRPGPIEPALRAMLTRQV